VAVEVQKIEGYEVEVVLAAHNGFAQRREIGQAGFVGDDDLAVDDRLVRLKLQGDLGEAAVF
jgi:hypothetical protein